MSRAHGLVDTGALIALVNADDRWHLPCVEALHSLRLPLATSAAVLTELFHFIGDRQNLASAAWKLLGSEMATVLAITDSDMPDLKRLMERYADRPMDFADATLVHLAEKESLTTVFTVDHNDFETYRIGAKGRFRILPTRQALT